MVLEITNYNNHYVVKGTLNKTSVETFKHHFSNIFEKVETVIIDIEKLETIDRYGVMALAKLHNQAINKQKRMSIIGIGCKELYDHFRSEDTAA